MDRFHGRCSLRLKACKNVEVPMASEKFGGRIFRRRPFVGYSASPVALTGQAPVASGVLPQSALVRGVHRHKGGLDAVRCFWRKRPCWMGGHSHGPHARPADWNRHHFARRRHPTSTRARIMTGLSSDRWSSPPSGFPERERISRSPRMNEVAEGHHV